MYEDTDPKHLVELPETEIAIIEDSLLYMEEFMEDMGEAYKRGREDNYYKFFEDKANSAKKIRTKLEDTTGVKTPNMPEYVEESRKYIGDNYEKNFGNQE